MDESKEGREYEEACKHRALLHPRRGGPRKVFATSLVSFPRAGKQAGALRPSLSPRGSFRAAPRGQRNCIFAMSGHHRRPGDAGVLSTTDANCDIESREMPATTSEAPLRPRANQRVHKCLPTLDRMPRPNVSVCRNDAGWPAGRPWTGPAAASPESSVVGSLPPAQRQCRRTEQDR